MKQSLLLFIPVMLCACTSHKCVHAIPVKAISQDSLIHSTAQYDSVYIYEEIIYEPLDSASAMLPTFKGGPGRISALKTEYRYRLLHDTIRISKVDSIPYEVRVTQTVPVSKPPNLFNYICILSFGILVGLIGWKILRWL